MNDVTNIMTVQYDPSICNILTTGSSFTYVYKLDKKDVALELVSNLVYVNKIKTLLEMTL